MEEQPIFQITGSRLFKDFQKLREEIGMVDFRWHDLRHCTASYLAMNGSTPSEIAELLGHKTLQMVKRYAHLSDSHNSQVLESMNDKLFGNVKGIKS